MFGEFHMMSFLPASLAGRQSLPLRPLSPRRYLPIAETHVDKAVVQVKLK